jgi:hypothetical protein
MAVLALSINMVMVDSQNAYKVMAFLFLLAGAQVQTAQTTVPRQMESA